MLKYVNTGIVFQEIPDEVTLAINISGCPCRCPGCHSQYLWEDIGMPLTTDAIDEFVEKNGKDITCIAFMGGDAEPRRINRLATSTTSRSVLTSSTSVRSTVPPPTSGSTRTPTTIRGRTSRAVSGRRGETRHKDILRTDSREAHKRSPVQ